MASKRILGGFVCSDVFFCTFDVAFIKYVDAFAIHFVTLFSTTVFSECEWWLEFGCVLLSVCRPLFVCSGLLDLSFASRLCSFFQRLWTILT